MVENTRNEIVNKDSELLEMELENIMAAGVDRGQIEIVFYKSYSGGVYFPVIRFKESGFGYHV